MPDQLVSIIIPAYNAGKYISETINSALTQTWPEKEIIIINNGSTDNTAEVLNSFDNNAVKIITQQNNGASGARNTGLKAAKGAYIQFLDADDLLSPEKIESQLHCLNNSHTEISICKNVQFTDGTDPYMQQPDANWYYRDHDDMVDFLKKLYAYDDTMPGYGGMVPVHSWLTPRAVIDNAGLWNESLSTDDDGEFFCRVVLASGGIKFSDDGVNYYRKYRHQQSLSAAKALSNYQSRLLATDLKYAHLKAKDRHPIIDKLFARSYWWLGVEAYPQYQALSEESIRKAKKLGYSGEKYVGGARGHLLTKFLGWKLARLISHYRHN